MKNTSENRIENGIEIPAEYTSLEFVRPISWEEIFDQWRKGEAGQESWKRHWEERGFDSWDEWRTAYAEPLQPASLHWSLYEIKNPLKEFPLIFGVPTDAWIRKVYNGETTKQLRKITDSPFFQENEKVSSIKKSFPQETMLTGLVHENKIILIEGMHRACALAGWDKNIPLDSEITIALALWDKEISRIGGNYKNKS
jgi:hypothetical protein